MSLAADHDGVDNRTALARVGMSNEQPILFTDGRGTDRILDKIIINLQVTALAIDLRPAPDSQGVVAGLSG